ncbi:hypothetical protein CYL18_14765 [Pradoshia eiseniae]|uniref:Uncharacterized protein n=1 Tax=Pradoshia eiseniae TaxID=2064768 RepID=A0A2S7MX34_9BACI|nr:hypothetical protein [Pradoshia eiseniae]PQD94298.1 hypothetical protein CYL18_14765 [Pradoshia eiseniae]
MTVNYQYYPKNNRLPDFLECVVEVFSEMTITIASTNKRYKSNDILEECKEGLLQLGYKVEGNHNVDGKYIEVPVLFGRNNVLEKSFRADAYNEELRSVIEVEAGRGVLNNQFLKDLFQACMMQDVEYLTIAVLNEYRTTNRLNYNFEEVCKFFDALYSSDRLKLPLKGILIVGYDTPIVEVIEELPGKITE